MPLPGLEDLAIEPRFSLNTSLVIEGTDLAALVGARKAASTGRSSRDVAAIASRLLDTLDATASEGEPAFGSARPCSTIRLLKSDISVKADEATVNWLKKNVRILEIDKWT